MQPIEDQRDQDHESKNPQDPADHRFLKGGGLDFPLLPFPFALRRHPLARTSEKRGITHGTGVFLHPSLLTSASSDNAIFEDSPFS